YAVQANSEDEQALLELGIRNVDYAVVALGDKILSSILTTLLLIELGVKSVWVKAQNKYHYKILKRIGADRIIQPESDMAKRVAHYIVSEKIIDFDELSDDYSIVKLRATQKIAGKTLIDLDIRS